MKPKIKEKWIKALRSGDYLQGNGALKRILNEVTTHCCLGVLCDLHSKEIGEKWVYDPLEPSCHLGAHMYYTRMGVLPDEVLDWAGLKNWDSNVAIDRNNLVDLNDDEEYTFEQIAEVIEGKL